MKKKQTVIGLLVCMTVFFFTIIANPRETFAYGKKTKEFAIENLGENSYIMLQYTDDRYPSNNRFLEDGYRVTAGSSKTFTWPQGGRITVTITAVAYQSYYARVKMENVNVDQYTPYLFIYSGTKTGFYPSGFTRGSETGTGMDEYITPNHIFDDQFDSNATCYFYCGAAFANSTVRVSWTAKNYLITFNGNAPSGAGSASVAPGYKNVVYNKKYGTLATASLSGYTFDGWYTEASGGTKITEDTIYTTAGNSTLYAHWTAKNYTVTFNGNAPSGAGSASVAPGYKNVVYNKKYGTLATASLSGYTFNGWYTSASGGTKVTEDTIYTTAGNSTLYAHWTVKRYTVAFNGNEPSEAGTASVSPGSKTVTYRAKYGTLATASLSGYTFNGWYTSASGGTKVTEDTIYTTAGNSTLYAHWTAKRYTVAFNGNEPSAAGTASVSPGSKTVTYRAKYGTLATASLSGYTFNGWYTSANGGTKVTEDTIYTTAGNSTLYAHWSAKGYDLHADPNGGSAKSVYRPSSESTAEAVHTGDFLVSAILPQFGSKCLIYNGTYWNHLYVQSFPYIGSICIEDVKREGYTLTGWYTAASGGRKIYNADGTNTNDGVYWKDGKYVHAGNLTVYAHWMQNPPEPDPDPDPEPEPEPEPEPDPDPDPEPDPEPGPEPDPEPEPGPDPEPEPGPDPEPEPGPDPEPEPGPDPEPGPGPGPDPEPDTPPVIAAKDLYFTLEEAKSGAITESAIGVTAHAEDAEDGIILYGIHENTMLILTDYQPEDFTGFTKAGSVTETFWAEDHSGNTAAARITVHIVDTEPVSGQELLGRIRFLSPKYWKREDGLPVPKAAGGFDGNSRWVCLPEYRDLLDHLLGSRM